jgi:hypothetical protein
MKITIEIEPKELAALVLELQEQPGVDMIATEVSGKLAERIKTDPSFPHTV